MIHLFSSKTSCDSVQLALLQTMPEILVNHSELKLLTGLTNECQGHIYDKIQYYINQ